MADDLPVLLLVGDSSHSEFADAIKLMRASCRVIELMGPAEAIAWCKAADSPPALVVIAAARSGRFSEESVERLRQRLPLTPCVALLGTWCEGEMRSGAPWPGVERVYWHQWPQRFEQALGSLIAGRCGSWNLPVTSTAEERLLWRSSTATQRRRGVVAIVADRAEAAEWLVATCRSLGWSAVWSSTWGLAKTRGIDVVVWDAGLIMPETFDQLQDIRHSFSDVPIVVLTDFPRKDDNRRLTAAGATAVLSKPVSVNDLDWQLSAKG